MTELTQSIILEMRREHRAHIKRGLNWNPECGICRIGMQSDYRQPQEKPSTA